MPTKKITYRSIFDKAVELGHIDTIKDILYEFKVPGNQHVIHNIAVIITKKRQIPESIYKPHVMNALEKMSKTVYQAAYNE